jgi:hypothetical protein
VPRSKICEKYTGEVPGLSRPPYVKLMFLTESNVPVMKPRAGNPAASEAQLWPFHAQVSEKLMPALEMGRPPAARVTDRAAS